MSVTVITPPEPIVSLDEAKQHLRVEHDSDDAYIDGLIAVATSAIDGPSGWLGRALGEQTLETRFDCWPRPLKLPYPPEIEIVSVTYIDPAGVEQSWPLTEPLPYDDLPAVRGRRADIRIRWKAGYPAGKVPGAIRHAILLMVGDLYANRENGGPSASAAAVNMPVTADRLLQPFRVYFG